MDGTQDITRIEQQSICILKAHEAFVGFYEVDGTTGNQLASCINDCLLRFQLPLE